LRFAVVTVQCIPPSLEL